MLIVKFLFLQNKYENLDATYYILLRKKLRGDTVALSSVLRATNVIKVRKENNVLLGDLQDDDIREEVSEKLFNKKNLDLIEAAFEQWTYFDKFDKEYISIDYGDDTIKVVPELVKFCKRYPDKTDRLKAIVKNAIKNEGVFKP